MIDFPVSTATQPTRVLSLVGDAERDLVCGTLAERFATGHLDQAEFDARTLMALQARSRTELSSALAGLPMTVPPSSVLPQTRPLAAEVGPRAGLRESLPTAFALLGLLGSSGVALLGFLGCLSSGMDAGFAFALMLATITGVVFGGSGGYLLHRR